MKRKTFLLKSLVLSVALLVFFALALVGCGGDDDTTPSLGTPAGGSSVADSTGTSSSTDLAPCQHKGGTATCAAKAVCTECGEEYGELAAHDYADATCTAPKTCKACQATDGAPLGHDKVEDVVAPTCVAGGITNISCSRCDYTATKDPVAPTGEHKYDVKGETVAPTCTEAGYTVYGCAAGACGTTQNRNPVGAFGHNYKDDVIAPTCVAGGITNISCSRCDYSETKDPTDPTGVHVYDKVNSLVEPTCTEAGYTVYGCSAGECGTTETRDEVDPLDHDYTVPAGAIEPTCVENGYDVFKCERCTETKTVPNGETATGVHVLEYFKTVKPTCSVVGHKLYKCKTCDLTRMNPDMSAPNEPVEEDIVATVPHNYDYATVDGLVACFMCGKGYRDVTVEKAEGNDPFCMGCGKEPCECGASGEWNGFTPAKAPEQMTASTVFTKSEVALSSGNVALQIGGGLIVLAGEAETTYTVVLYAAVDGEAVGTIEVSGDYVLVFLDDYESVVKVEITASTDATVSFYVAE